MGGQNDQERGRDSKSGEVLVRVSPKYFRPTEVDELLGNSDKAKKDFGWESKTSFEQLVQIMVEADMKNKFIIALTSL